MSEQHPKEHAVSTRRDFLKTAAVAGTALTTGLALAPAVHAAGSDTIKVGLIGCGGRGTGAADNVMHSAPNVKIVAIGDVFKFRADGCRKHLQDLAKSDEVKKLGNSVDVPENRCFDGLDAYEKVIASDANYIILATPPGFRPVHIQAVVAAGKNLFTEKPVGVDGTGIRKVLAAYEDASKKDLRVVAGTQRRHEAAYLDTIEQIHDGAIGDVVALRCYWNQGNIWFRNRNELERHGIKDSDLAYQLHNWYHFVWTCGDHICEQHIHNLDVCNWVMQKHPVKVVSSGGRAALPMGNPAELGHIFDHFVNDYDYGNNVHMLSMCRQIGNADGSVSEAVMGTKGFCQVNAHSINGKRVAGKRKGADPYVQEHTDLIACIREGKPINELKQVAESTLTAIMARMSAYTGKEVTWEKALNSKLDTMPQQLSWEMSLPVPSVAIPGKTPLV